jgi:hypothetical protein
MARKITAARAFVGGFIHDQPNAINERHPHRNQCGSGAIVQMQPIVLDALAFVDKHTEWNSESFFSGTTTDFS